MKLCPACHTQYTDDTLEFCLQDGTRLTSGRQSDTPTVVLGETETAAARGGQTNLTDEAAEQRTWQQSQVTRVASAMPTTASTSKTPLVVVAAVLAVFALLSVVVIGVILLRNFGASGGTGFPNNATPISDPNRLTSPTPTSSPGASASPTPTGSPSSNSNISTQPPADVERTKNEVSQKVNTWKSLLESHDLSSYMSSYDDSVNYYGAGTVPQSRVRTDKERAMSMYSSIRVTVSNMSVTVSPAGDTATAVFDKEWVFEGGGKRNVGKTQAKLDFRKVNDKWLITGERDQKVYYSR